MDKRLLLLVVGLAAPAVAAIAWMLIPAPQQDPIVSSIAPSESETPAHGSRAASAFSKITRPAENDAPEMPPDPALAPVPASPQIAPRFSPAANSVKPPRRDAVNGTGLQPTDRVRVLPAGAHSQTETPESRAKKPGSPVILAIDRSLHDPAAWIEDAPGRTSAQADVKTQIADDFAATVAAAAKNPQTPAEGIDSVWKTAKVAADANYRKMFGDAAFSRAAVIAGRDAALTR